MNGRIRKVVGILLISSVVGAVYFIYKSGGAEGWEVIYSVVGPWIVVCAFLLLWELLGKNHKGER